MRHLTRHPYAWLAIMFMCMPFLALNACTSALTAQTPSNPSGGNQGSASPGSVPSTLPGQCYNGVEVVPIQAGTCPSPAGGVSSAQPQAPASPGAQPSSGAGSPASPAPASSGSGSTGNAGSSGLQVVSFWEVLKDKSLAFTSVPKSVTTTGVAFATGLGSGTFAPLGNTTPLTAGAAAIHANGGKVLISFGGALGTATYGSLDPATFTQDLTAFFNANPGMYDGVDFDDEQDPRNNQTLINVIKATRAAFPNIIITYDAFSSGADPGTGGSDWQGTDIPVAAAVAQSIDWVNVMDFNIGTWRPSTNKTCTPSPGASDDCYKDIIAQFAKIFPANKIVMGLLVPQDGSVSMSASNVSTYTQWAKSNGYRGMMIWDLNLDTGFSAVNAAAGALGL